MGKIIRLTEGELTHLIKKILSETKELKSPAEPCYKEFKSPYPGDPYKYKMGFECIWFTKSDESKKQTGKKIVDWIHLLKNEEANRKLNKWFPNVQQECIKCQSKYLNKTITPINDLINQRKKLECPKTLDCQPKRGVKKPDLCSDNKSIEACKKQGMTVTN